MARKEHNRGGAVGDLIEKRIGQEYDVRGVCAHETRWLRWGHKLGVGVTMREIGQGEMRS